LFDEVIECPLNFLYSSYDNIIHEVTAVPELSNLIDFATKLLVRNNIREVFIMLVHNL